MSRTKFAITIINSDSQVQKGPTLREKTWFVYLYLKHEKHEKHLEMLGLHVFVSHLFSTLKLAIIAGKGYDQNSPDSWFGSQCDQNALFSRHFILPQLQQNESFVLEQRVVEGFTQSDMRNVCRWCCFGEVDMRCSLCMGNFIQFLNQHLNF